jgi:hypothetical protein
VGWGHSTPYSPQVILQALRPERERQHFFKKKGHIQIFFKKCQIKRSNKAVCACTNKTGGGKEVIDGPVLVGPVLHMNMFVHIMMFIES